MNRFAIFTIFIFFHCAGYSQPTVGLVSYKEQRVSEGYNLFYPHNQEKVYLINNCGEIVHFWEDDVNYRPGNSVYLLENGDLVKCKRLNTSLGDPIWAGGGGAIVEVLDWNNDLKYSFELNDSINRLHHDVEPMPNGNILMLAWDRKNLEEALAAGRDPALLSLNELWSESVIEWDPVSDSIVWEWHAWDHLIQDFDTSKSNYGNVADHPELIDINYDEHDGHPDWMHLNAIDYNPVLDQIVLSNPYFNEIWIIDHSTTKEEAAGHGGGKAQKGGDLLFRWGNPATYRGPDSLKQLFFQHDPTWIDPMAPKEDESFGKILLFNNRVDVTLSTMLVIDTDPDTSNHTYRMTDKVFDPEEPSMVYTHPDSSVRAFSNGVSSVMLLPNGNLFTFSGRWGYGYEMTPDNEIVWEYIVPLRAGHPVRQGDTLGISENLTFRMTRYPVDYGAFDGKDLSAKGYLELNPDSLFCPSYITSTTNQKTTNLTAYPNPAHSQIFLNIESSDHVYLNVQIFDVYGRLVDLQDTTVNSAISIENLTPGIYLGRLSTGETFSFYKL